jgi:hypothetical protein
MGWSGIFAAVREVEPRQESLVHGDADGTATLRIDTAEGVVRVKDNVRMRIPIWYDAMQAPIAVARRVALERGARPQARLAPSPELAMAESL